MTGKRWITLVLVRLLRFLNIHGADSECCQIDQTVKLIVEVVGVCVCVCVWGCVGVGVMEQLK